MNDLAVGVQLWSVKDDVAKDLPGTLRRIAEAWAVHLDGFEGSALPAKMP